MYVTRISFSRMNSPAQGEESSTETVDRVLGTWRMNGQVCGREWPFVSEGSGYSITALTPERNSLESVFNSSLTEAGRKNCQTLAASSGRPFHYYLYQDSGESHQAELARRCPGCDGEWKLASCLHSHFDFKCDCCNLLSNIAFDLRG